MIAYVIGIVVVALVFDFINGFHDSANSIATIVGTRVLSPFTAVLWAAAFNFAALFTVGTAVAKAISSGYVDQIVDLANVILGGAARRDHLEPDHLVVRHSVQLVARADRWIRRRGGCQQAGSGRSMWGPKWIETLTAIVISPPLARCSGIDADGRSCTAFRRESRRARWTDSFDRRS